MTEPSRPLLQNNSIPIPQSCLTALLTLPARLLALPVIWALTRLKRTLP
jgi:hypothetical protein